jgi:adenine-specific DNA methylase
MDFCYVWLRRLVDDPLFAKQSTRHLNELTGNTTFARTIEHFTDGLSDVFSKMAKALKSNAPLAFTFHHNNLTAYAPVAVAILDSKLNCTASIPCPAEMAASIHIHGTASSIIDTVFVCRSRDATPVSREIPDPENLARIVTEDIESLRNGGVKPTKGDIRCIVFGHLTRAAVQELRNGWKANRPTMSRLKAVQDWFAEFCDSESIAMNTLTNGIGNEVSV